MVGVAVMAAALRVSGTKQLVQNATLNVKSLLNQEATVRFSARIVSLNAKILAVKNVSNIFREYTSHH